jgi:transcriptional regulator with XRE-family HTH domain
MASCASTIHAAGGTRRPDEYDWTVCGERPVCRASQARVRPWSASSRRQGCASRSAMTMQGMYGEPDAMSIHPYNRMQTGVAYCHQADSRLGVRQGVQSASQYRKGNIAVQDTAASTRLFRELERLYHQKTGERLTKSALSRSSGISRTTLDGYIEGGMWPSPENMQRLAAAVDVPHAHLWARWLGLGMSEPEDHLKRIADALERAYPPTPSAGTRDSGAVLQDHEGARVAAQHARELATRPQPDPAKGRASA